MRVAIAALLLAAVSASASASATTSERGGYRIDPVRSHATFSVRLLWLRRIRGRFTEIDGEVQVGADAMATVDARVPLDSAAMPSARSRRQMLGPEFFDAQHYPRVRFQSDPLPATRLTHGGSIEGRLTLRGVTRRVRLHLQPVHCRQLGASMCLLDVHGTVHRSDFGMNAHRAALSNEVKLGLLIALEPRQH